MPCASSQGCHLVPPLQAEAPAPHQSLKRGACGATKAYPKGLMHACMAAGQLIRGGLGQGGASLHFT